MVEALLQYSLLEKIKEKQHNLQSENSMVLVERCSKKYQRQSTRSEYLRLLSLYKVHYSIAGDFICYRKEVSDIFCKPTNDLIYIEKSIPSFTELFSKLKEEKYYNQTNINFFTFSIFPSLMNFFFYSPRFNIDLLEKIVQNTYKENKDLFYQISRAFFVSPEFITFCQIVIQPIFSDIQDHFEKSGDISTNEFSDFVDKLYINICAELRNKKFYSIPKFICHVYIKCDPHLVLKESFLKIAFKDYESLIFYGLFHYSKPPTEALFKALKTIFMNEYEEGSKLNSIKTCFYAIFLKIDSTFLNIPFNIKDGLKEYSSAILSNNDLSFFNCIEENRQIKFQKNYFEYYICNDKNPNNFVTEISFDDSDDSDNEYIIKEIDDDNYFYENNEKTMSDYNLFFEKTIISKMRHLLQSTDPIPEIKEEIIAKTHLTFRKFFDEMLVLRGPIESIPKRREYAAEIIAYVDAELLSQNNDPDKPNNLSVEKILDPVLNDILCSKPEQANLCQLFYSQSNVINELRKFNQKGLSNAKLTSSLTQFQSKIKISDYFKYPTELLKDFQRYSNDNEYQNLFVLLNLFKQGHKDGNLYKNFFIEKVKQANYINQLSLKNDDLIKTTLIELIKHQKSREFIEEFILKEQNEIDPNMLPPDQSFKPTGKELISKMYSALQEKSIFRMIDNVLDINDAFLMIFDKSDVDLKNEVSKAVIVLTKSPNLNLINDFCELYLKQFELERKCDNENNILFSFRKFLALINDSWLFNQEIITKMNQNGS